MISEGFVTNGATVYISSRDAKSCDQAVQELNALGKGKAHAIPANFYKEEDCQKLADELKKRESSESFCFMLGGMSVRNMTNYKYFIQSSTFLSITPDRTGVPHTTNTRRPRGHGSLL